MDKSTTGFMAGFRTSEQTPFDIEMRFTMNKLLSCRYNMDTAIQLFNVAATSLDCVSPIYYLYVALIFISLRFRNKTKVVGITMILTTLAK